MKAMRNCKEGYRELVMTPWNDLKGKSLNDYIKLEPSKDLDEGM